MPGRARRHWKRRGVNIGRDAAAGLQHGVDLGQVGDHLRVVQVAGAVLDPAGKRFPPRRVGAHVVDQHPGRRQGVLDIGVGQVGVAHRVPLVFRAASVH